MIVDGYMLRSGEKKFNVLAAIATVVVLAVWLVPIYLTFFVSEPFLLLGFVSWFISWAVCQIFDEYDKFAVIKRNYKYSEIHKPKNHYGQEILTVLDELMTKYDHELKMLGGMDALFDETMDFIVAYDKDLIKEGADRDIRFKLTKMKELLELCKRERARAEEEQRKMLGRETRSDVLDSILDVARKEYR